MGQLFLYIVIVSYMLLGLLKSIPGRSSVLPFLVSAAIWMQPVMGPCTILVGSRCGWESKVETGKSQTVGRILESIRENKKGICLRHLHYPHLISLPVWDPEQAGPDCGVSSFGFSTVIPCRLTHSKKAWLRPGCPGVSRLCQSQGGG